MSHSPAGPRRESSLHCLVLFQLQHDGPQPRYVLGVARCLGTEITMFGNPLPLRARLDVVHLVPLVFGLLLPVAGLGLLNLSLVSLVPVLKLLLCLLLQLLLSCRLLVVLLPQSLLLLLFPLPHKLGLLLGDVHLGHSCRDLCGCLGLADVRGQLECLLSSSRGYPQVLSDIS